MIIAPHAGEPPVVMAQRLRVLVGAVLGTVLISYLLMAVVAALAGLSAGAPPAPMTVLTAGVGLWLAAHQVPLTLAGAPFGALPLLPSVAVAAVAAHFASAAIGKLGGRWGGEAAWVVATLAGVQASLAVLGTALPTDPMRAEPWQALLGGGLVTTVGAGLGVLRVVGAPHWPPAAPSWLRSGVAGSAIGAFALLAAGALMLFAALAAEADAVHDQFQARPGVGVGLGVAVLSVCYVPNAVVAAVSWLAGPGIVVGAMAASPVSVSVGPLPPIPLLAAMPTSQPPGWSVVVFALPVAAGVLVGLGCRRSEDDAMDRLRAVAVAAVVVAAGFWVLASVVSGRLAGGPFDPVELPALSGALALLGWVGLPASVAALVPAGLGWPRRLSEGEPEPGRADQPEPGRADQPEPGRADQPEPGRADQPEPESGAG